MNFQDIIFSLHEFWKKYGCVVLNPASTEVGAGTLNPMTLFNCLGEHSCDIAYVQPVIRPTDGRFGDNPNRLYQHHQYQVILKPSPNDCQELYLDSLKCLGISMQKHDIKFVCDDWENPSIGASGLGWEVCCDGMEISQFTYMQQIGGIECKPIPVEFAYGLERIAMYLQDVDSIYDVMWNNHLTYGQIFKRNEYEFSHAAFNHYDSKILFDAIEYIELFSKKLVKNNLPIAAYDQCLKASHYLNLLDSRGVLGVMQRANYILKIRGLVKECCENYLSME